MRKLFSAAALSTSLLFGSVALADDKRPHADHSAVKPMSAPKSDKDFAVHMAHHHRDGIAMADHVIAKGASAEVKEMARRLKDDQTKELVMLDRMAKTTEKKAGKAASHPPKDPDMEKAMARLKAASGADADRLFLEHMITHHAGAIMMFHDALPHLRDGELRRMATEGFSKQAREIGELQKMRESDRSARK